MQRLFQSFLLFCLLLTTEATPLCAKTVELPLFLRAQILQNALVESLTPQPERPTVLFQEGSYNYLHISKPQLSIRDGQPYFSCNATAGMGFDSLGVLPSVVKWSGSILMKLNFYVDPQWQLRYRIIDSAIYNEKGGKPVVSGFAWELCKRFLHPRLEQYAFDLAMPKKDITALLRACSSPTNTAPLETALNTLTVGTLRTNADGLIVPLLLTVADAQTQAVTPLPPQAPLGFEEMEKLQHVFEPLDAFLVFIIKNLSADTVNAPVNAQQQKQLFDLLITSRYQLLMILTGQTPMESEDPLRLLFIDAWEQLRPIIEQNSGKNGLMQKQLLRYMTFINAGDALLTLDAAAPDLGIHLTSDGLRRLARMLQPGSGEDPLHFDWQIDPALRQLFQFQPEPEAKLQDFPPDSTQKSPADFPPESMPVPTPAPASNSTPDSTPQTAPKPIIEQDIPAPPTHDSTLNPPDPAQGSTTGQYLLNFLVGVAHAENSPPMIMIGTDLNKRLDHWVPTTEELAEYEKIISQLLKSFAREQVKQDNLEPRYATIYQHLVPATAMIESCWQQYERKDDKIVTLRSPSGGIGIMQINQHVWRGFYNIERLQGDVAYNIQAGSQILMRYFKEYGTQVAKENGNPAHAARAAYAAYNAGPRASRRFMKPDSNARQKRVDEHLWNLYQKIAAGGSADVANCNIL
ncbi:MAG: transglycosylase SLT domain-containing protein [Deltaproteobacteria bacterium]|nr:transglycosylase SLT domain-containing protein [Deltaproteobacteria bacterium]